MMPFSDIHIGDQFEDPLLRPYGLTWIVLDTNKDEKMIKVHGVDPHTVKEVGAPVWKKNTDKMFSEGWRVFDYAAFTEKQASKANKRR